MPTVLVVDDEPDIVELIRRSLTLEGFDVVTAASGHEALEAADGPDLPDLILLDWMLPDLSGTEVCRRLRASDSHRDTPIVMVSARGEEIDRVVGFEVGADDYVVKPFSVRELALRVRAILRRLGTRSRPDPDETTFGRLRVDPDGYRVFVDDEPVDLTPTELALLRSLLEQPGRALSRDDLLREVWSDTDGLSTRTVDTHVKRLRHKLGSAGRYIVTLRGVGYRMTPAD